MTREEHLKFCSICKKRQMDIQRGVVCSLTNEYADFEEKCIDFEVDEDAAVKELVKQQKLQKEVRRTGGKLTGSNWFLWIGILSIVNIVLGFVSNIQFVFGLGVTQLIQGITLATGTEILGVVLSLVISAFYIWTYYLAARKEQLWAYATGWVIYFLDALIFLVLLTQVFDFSIIWSLLLHAILLVVLYSSNPLVKSNTWQSIKTFEWTHESIAYVVYGGMVLLIQICSLIFVGMLSLQN